MPELPEVETTVRELRKKIASKSIVDVWTDYSSNYKHYKDQIKNPAYFAQFKKEAKDRKIQDVERRGKNILIHLSGGRAILVHMKMTGHILYGKYIQRKVTDDAKNASILPEKWKNEKWIPEAEESSPLWDPFNRHLHLVFTLSDGKNVVLSDARKFARVKIFTKEELYESKELSRLGPNPLEISAEQFIKRLHSRNAGKIKQVLMDQRVLAGVGNIYSDEALWSTGIHPASSLKAIPDKKLKALHKNLVRVLKEGLNLKGDSTSDYRKPDGRRGEFHHTHNVYGKRGEPCPKDGAIIEKATVGGRTAHYCPKHQKKY